MPAVRETWPGDQPPDHGEPAPGLGPPSGEPPRPPRRTGAAVAVACALALVAGATGAMIALRFEPSRSVTRSAPVTSQTAAGAGQTQQLAKVAASVLPSVVMIKATTATGTSEGSGVILESDGVIVTNNHVISDAADGNGSISVTFDDGSTADATILGRDTATDVAVIRAAGVSGLTPATLGSASSLHVGDMVLAVGSPLGLAGSVTAGVVSALHRTVVVGGGDSGEPGESGEATQSITDAIQTDASINPGSSGGPLADSAGRVIGIATAIASTGGGYIGQQAGSIGVGFAIPMDTVDRIANRLIRG
ncbi:MAG: S1C family serine protease [Micromonosporaceae bacterium]